MSVEEKQEQHQLRQEYLGMIRGQVLHTFSTMKVLDPLGQDVTPDKVYDLRENTAIFKKISCIQSKALEIDFSRAFYFS